MKNPLVTIKMKNKHKITIELYPRIAPNTVRNFIYLIEQGFYNETIFHRVIPGFMIQGGDPQGTGVGGPGYTITGEFNRNGFKNELKHTKGIISMARTMDPNSAGSQFFIMVEDAPHLDGNYASFGKVIEGMEEVENIANQKRDQNDKPIIPQIISSITVQKFKGEYDKPKKVQN